MQFARQLLYGLESAQLNESVKKRLDTFQLRGLRKILGMKTTFIDRSNTNEEVFRRANEKANEGQEGTNRKYKEIRKLSTCYKDMRRNTNIKLISKRNKGHKETEITMKEDTLRLNEYDKKRVGYPKNQWWINAMEELWKWIKQNREDPEIRSLPQALH